MGIILATSRSFSDGDIDLVARATEAGHEIVRGPAHHDLADLAPLLATGLVGPSTCRQVRQSTTPSQRE